MANRNKGRRGRSRKRRPAGGASQGATDAVSTTTVDSAQSAPVSARDARAGAEARAARKRAAARSGAGRAKSAGDDYRAPGSLGERPRAPWHPVPLDELLIFVGLIAVAVGAARGESGKAILFVGIGAVLIGTIDTTFREHLSGYRSHAGVLASVPTALFHGAAALLLFVLGAPRVTWVLVPLALDVPIFSLLLKLLRARFADARRERVFSGNR